VSTTPSDPPAPPAPSALPTGYAQEAPPPLGTARRTSPLTVGIELAALVGSVLFELLTRRLGPETPSSPFDPGMATIPLLLLGPRVLRWWFRTYTLTDTHMELNEGVLQRRHRVVPYSRVQQVDLRRHLLAQMFGLGALHIETAGEGGASAVSLSLLRMDDAASVRRFVLDRRDHTSGAGASIDGDGGGERAPVLTYELARMSVSDLLLSALTQGPGMLTTLLLAAAFPWLLGAAVSEEPTLAGAVVAVGLGLGLVATVVHAVGRLLGDWGWVLTHRGDDLHLRAGSFSVREQSVPRRRVQRVTIVDNPLRRMFGFTSVVLHTAVPAGTQQGVSPLVEVPLLRRGQVDDFLVRVMGPDWTVPALEPRRPAAARRSVMRRLLLLLPGAVGPGLVFGGVAWVTVVVALGAVPWGRAAHRRAGHAVAGGRVALAAGVLTHRVDLVPLDRIQSARTRSSPAQRRLDLATFHVDVAGSTWVGSLTRSPSLFDMDAATAAELRRTLPT